jgi:5-methylcytosine-specific restriction endonuclease McrA
MTDIDALFDARNIKALPTTRAVAKTIGSDRYFTGKACLNGHVASRRTNDKKCVDCVTERDRRRWDARKEIQNAKRSERRRKNLAEERAKARARWQQNLEEERAKARARYHADKLPKLLYQRRYRAENSDTAREAVRSWNRANKDKKLVHQRNYRARKAAAEGRHTAADIRKLRAAQKDNCACCGTGLEGKGHVDHIVSLKRGGSNWPDNLQLLCAACNIGKGARPFEEFIELRQAAPPPPPGTTRAQ